MKQKVISEAASKKRGRPSVLPPWWDKKFEKSTKTNRGQQNRYYAYVALEALGLIERLKKGFRHAPRKYAWLIDWEAAERNAKGAEKVGVLAELGRIAQAFGDDVARNVAAATCRDYANVKTAKQAETDLRRWRLWHMRQGSQ